MSLIVTSGAIVTLLEEAKAAHPLECCGLLVGERRIERAHPARNLATDPSRHFEIDPVALIAAHKAAREGGAAVLGYYHSHPRGPAVPSAIDRAAAAGDGRVWAIVAGSVVCFWRDAPGGFEALPYEVVGG